MKDSEEEPVSPEDTKLWCTECTSGVLDAFGDSQGQEGQEEARRPKVITMPRAPKQEEVDEHNTTHCPFRAWCPHCVAGKAVSDPHVHKGTDDNGVPIVSIDYMYMTEGTEERGQPILVGVDGSNRTMFAHVMKE